MKKLNLYYVYDNVGETVITDIIPAPNDLVALIGFRDHFIKSPNQKMPYNYKALDLVRFARLNVDEDGCLSISTLPSDTEIKRIIGADVMSQIELMSEELGIKDDILDDNDVDKEVT